MAASDKTGFAPVNGLNMYYEIHGEGNPLVLLHGGITASDCFGDNLIELAKTRQVIAVHLQGHGFTRDIDREWNCETFGDDVAALIRSLGHRQVDVLGYSLGGGVALRLAIQHPALVRKLVVVSATFAHDGSYPEVLAVFDAMEENAPVIAQGVSASPLADMYPDVDWVNSFVKTARMQQQGYDWSDELPRIAAQVMLVFADADSIRPEHMVQFYGLLGGGKRDAGLDGSLRPATHFAVLPGTTHYNIMSTLAVTRVTVPFLDAAVPASTAP